MIAHVRFDGRQAERLAELCGILGARLGLDRPVTASRAVRYAVAQTRKRLAAAGRGGPRGRRHPGPKEEGG